MNKICILDFPVTQGANMKNIQQFHPGLNCCIIPLTWYTNKELTVWFDRFISCTGPKWFYPVIAHWVCHLSISTNTFTTIMSLFWQIHELVSAGLFHIRYMLQQIVLFVVLGTLWKLLSQQWVTSCCVYLLGYLCNLSGLFMALIGTLSNLAVGSCTCIHLAPLSTSIKRALFHISG